MNLKDETKILTDEDISIVQKNIQKRLDVLINE